MYLFILCVLIILDICHMSTLLELKAVDCTPPRVDAVTDHVVLPVDVEQSIREAAEHVDELEVIYRLDDFPSGDVSDLDDNPDMLGEASDAEDSAHVSGEVLDPDDTSRGYSQPVETDIGWVSHEGGMYKRTSVPPWSVRNCGLAWHCFAGGFVRAMHFGVLYGLMLGTMAMPAHTYATIQTMLAVPWVLKLVFGPLSDSVALWGYRRRYYAVIGWGLVTAAHTVLLVLFAEPLPFYCSDGDGEFRGGAGVCNASAGEHAPVVVVALLCANVGLALAETAGDGLLVECVADMCDFASRSRTQIEALVLRMVGGGIGSMFLGIFFNSRRHLGFYESDIGMTGVGICCIFVSASVGAGWLFATRAEQHTRPVSRLGSMPTRSCARACGRYASLRRRICHSEFARFLMYQITVPAMLSFSSPAVDMMRKHWAHVEQMQQQFVVLVAAMVYILPICILYTAIEHVSWHGLLRATVCIQLAIQTGVYWTTALDIARDQYFFLLADLVQGIGVGMNFVISMLALVEMSPRGHEATVYGLVGAMYAISPALGRGVANFTFGLASDMLGVSRGLPSLVDDANYIADTEMFRAGVVVSVWAAAGVCTMSLVLLPMMPFDAADARKSAHTGRRRMCSSEFWCGLVTCVLCIAALAALTLNAMAIAPDTSCRHAFGGAGC